jgi:uncharacterized tellurite resistance protein B-like protein
MTGRSVYHGACGLGARRPSDPNLRAPSPTPERVTPGISWHTESVSLLKWLGIDSGDPGPPTDSVAEIEKALTNLEPARARYIACFAYILGRAARADHEISPAEADAMTRIVAERGNLPPDQAALVVRLAQDQGLRYGGTEDFIVTRQFAEIADRAQKLALVDCLLAVSAADEAIGTVEDNEVRRIVNEIRLEHADFIAARAAYQRHLSVLRKPGTESG